MELVKNQVNYCINFSHQNFVFHLKIKPSKPYNAQYKSYIATYLLFDTESYKNVNLWIDFLEMNGDMTYPPTGAMKTAVAYRKTVKIISIFYRVGIIIVWWFASAQWRSEEYVRLLLTKMLSLFIAFMCRSPGNLLRCYRDPSSDTN